ncbi:hypothetical protein PAAG_04715 [Paracoccidioides lutzii Pb01]|uniref:Cytochrome c oxidase assembly factor 3 mitochondrial coiled-coil domain-containing protein n=1 Tax=Paracoccidioides lutzii (strain ATCC MYA-826 / Pb01) TaxID=502779 RepID=C1H286_PARBA|nr:hypothetical protein PAAG_04715 [Paracoccidioides lutzii Pb01]EEH33666.2 hypothetical protein PAAG_04715 [Paracoccidioides lutzii Pb01]
MAIFKSSYYDKDYRAGAALLRARRPYLFKNAATGIALFAFCIGVCKLNPLPPSSNRTILTFSNYYGTIDAFTINAVGQDDFSDVIVPEKKMVDTEPAPAVK